MRTILTPLELKVMNILWKIQKGFIKDILDYWPGGEKKPAYNTVSTIVRILQEKKAFIDHESFGRTHCYFPIVDKGDYQKIFLNNAVEKVFSGSVSSLLSTLVDEDEMSMEDLERLKILINKKL